MATIYVDTDKYLDEVTYAAGDTIMPRYGATLTIRKSTTVNPAQISTTTGIIRIDSFASGAVNPIVVMFTDTTTGFNAGDVGKLIVRGDWYYLGTGNGNANQTFTFYGPTTGGLPWVQVETGEGTDEWVDFVGLTLLTLSSIGRGSLGRFFTYSESTRTLTFGDGTNGAVVPNGARVRCPSIFITSAAIATKSSYSSRNTFASLYTGYFDIDKILLSDRMWLNWIRVPSGKVSNLGCFGQAVISESMGIEIDRLIIAPSNHANLATSYSYIIGGTVTNSTWCSDVDDVWRPYLVSDCHFTDCNFFVLNRNDSGDCPVDLQNSAGISFTRCNFAGGAITLNNNSSVTLLECTHSDRMLPTKWTTYSTYAVSISGMTDLNIDQFSLHPDGCPCYNYVFFINSATRPVITNINYNMGNHSAMLFYIAAVEDGVFARGEVGQPRNQVYRGVSTLNNVKLIDILTTANGTTTSSPQGRGVLFDGVADGVGGAYSGSFDIPFLSLYDPATTISTGKLIFQAVAPNRTQNPAIISGTPYFDNSTAVVMERTGDIIEIESGVLIKGVSGFQNIAPVILGNYSTFYDVTYAIKFPGEDWGILKALTAENISSEVVDASVGFYLKVRVTCTGDRIAQPIPTSFASASIFTTINPDIKKPYLFVPITLDNIIPGSSYYVFRNSDNSLVSNGIAGSSKVIFNAEYRGSEQVTIRIRKKGYIPFETGGIINSSGLSSYISQQTDTIITI